MTLRYTMLIKLNKIVQQFALIPTLDVLEVLVCRLDYHQTSQWVLQDDGCVVATTRLCCQWF